MNGRFRRNLAIDARIGYRLDLRRKQSLVFRRDAHVFAVTTAAILVSPGSRF
jgi:hypothetical protein